MYKVGLTAFIFFISSVSAADFYQGIRQMGMGGAAIAVVNDETSLLLNPIGLGRLRESFITVIDPEITTNTASVSAIQDLALDVVDIGEIYDELQSHQDKNYFFRAQMFPSFATRNYGFGFLAKYDVSARRRSADQLLDLQYTSDWAGVIGYNKSFFGGQVKVGVSGRYIDRVEYIGEVDPSVQSLNTKALAVNGTAAAVDLGVSFTSPTQMLPTFSVLVKDLGDTSFTLGKGMRDDYLTIGDPAKIPMEMDVAVALFPIWSNSIRGSFTVEYDNALESGKAEKKLHAGFECNIADRFFLRGGWNRGYFTTGIEYATTRLQFQFAYYGEEIGTDDNPIKDDRLAAKVAYRF